MTLFLIIGLWSSCLMTSAKPFWVTIPKRADISCKIKVAIIDNSIAHSKLKPKSTPAKVQAVTVPGPIKAAATRTPGPNFLNICQFFIPVNIIGKIDFAHHT